MICHVTLENIYLVVLFLFYDDEHYRREYQYDAYCQAEGELLAEERAGYHHRGERLQAPIIAVGVDPMLFMATLMRKRLSTVGSNASCMPQIH